jgi:MtaA/CmuA family methyltransferase
MMSYSDMERFNDALKGRPRDRVPILPLNALWVAVNFPDHVFTEVANDPKLVFDAQIWAKELLGYDWLDPHVDPLYIPEAFGCNVRFPETGPLVDPFPIPFSSLKDVERLPVPDFKKVARLPVILETTRLMNEYAKGSVPVLAPFEGPFTTACRTLDAEVVMRMIYKAPKILEALLDKITEFLIAFGCALIESGANVALIPEPSASSSVISPSIFARFVVPRLRKLTANLPVPCVLHICGNTLPILAAMGQSGTDVLSLDQCMNLAEARVTYREAVFGGNVDPINALLMGDTEKVENDTLRCLRTGGTTHFMLMTGCAVPPNTPLENLKAMIKTVIAYESETALD